MLEAKTLLLPVGWQYFRGPVTHKVHVLWIGEEAELLERNRHMSRMLKHWSQKCGRSVQLQFWVDEAMWRAILKHELFFDDEDFVQFKRVEHLMASYIQRTCQGNAEDMTRKMLLYMRAAMAESMRRRRHREKQHMEKGMSPYDVKQERRPMQLLVDFFKHLVVLEDPGLYASWSISPFDLSASVEVETAQGGADKFQLVQKDTFWFGNGGKKEETTLLYFFPITVRSLTDAAMSNTPERHRDFIRRLGEQTKERLVDPDCDDEKILNLFKLHTAHQIYAALRMALEAMAQGVDEDQVSKTAAGVKLPNHYELDLEELVKEARIAKIIDKPSFFQDLYRANISIQTFKSGKRRH